MSAQNQLSRVTSAARQTARRLLLGSLLRRLALCLPVPLIYALAALTWIKVAHLNQRAVLWLAVVGVVCVLFVVLALLQVALRRRPELWGAQVLDRHHGLAGRLANALAFSREANPTPLQQAAIDDALAHASQLAPRQAAPLRWPQAMWISLGLCAALLGMAQLELRTHRFVPEVTSNIVPLLLPADDLELLRETAEQLAAQAQDPEVLAAARRFNQLVEDIAERRLDQQEVLRRLEQLEQGLMEESAIDKEGLDEGLKNLADELRKNGLTKPAAEALEQKKLADAETALKELAKRLREKPGSINKAELERLRKALEQASKQSAERTARIAEQREQLEAERRKLLSKKAQQPNQQLSKAEQQDLERKERQLKRLDRQKKSAERGAQQLSKLDQELAKAAQELMREMGDAAKHLEEGAQDLNRMAQKELSDSEKEALKKQLEELRQMLRQNQGSSEQRKQMLERFRQRAAGRGQGQPSDGKDGQGQGQGKQGQGGDRQVRLSLGPGGQPLPVPGPGGEGQGGPEGKGQSEGGKPGGTQAGNARDNNLRGDKSQLQGQTQDVSAAGIDSGQGESASEAVYGAAERGFAGRGYRKVYTDYKTVAEEVMDTDQIPPGYRFYVRRYFQLIRPRE